MKFLSRLYFSTFEEWRIAKQKKEQKEKQRIAFFINTSKMRAKIFEKHAWSLKYFSSQQLIDADFYYKLDDENKDVTSCHICEVEIFQWINDDVYEAHVKWSSDCLWLKKHHDELMIMRKHACRRCSTKFSNNIKFHQHIQNHHQKKIEKSVAIEFAMIASSNSITSNEIAMSTFLSTSEAKLARFTSSESIEIISTATFASITFFSTSEAKFAERTSSEFAEFTSKSIIAMQTFHATFSSNESTLMLTSSIDQSKSIFDISFSLISFVTSIATSRKQIFWIEIVSRSVIASKSSRFSTFTSKSIAKALKIASIICSSTSSSTSSQESVSKHQHQKSYLTIENLFEMFAEKRTKSNQLHIRKIEFFSKISRQFKITFYFRSAINQSKSITQNSKTSNSKNFHQHTFAKSNRVKFTFSISSKWFEKSINLSYKTSIFFRLFTSEISSISSYKSIDISRCKFSICSSFSFVFNVIFVFSHVCRICSDIFESNNDLHRHLRAIHFRQTSRHEFERLRALERNLENRWFHDEKIDRFLASLLVLLTDFSNDESLIFRHAKTVSAKHNENVVIFFRWWHLLR